MPSALVGDSLVAAVVSHGSYYERTVVLHYSHGGEPLLCTYWITWMVQLMSRVTGDAMLIRASTGLKTHSRELEAP